MHDEARRVFGLPLGEWLASFTSPKYLPMGIALYVALFAVFQFVLLLFNAASTTDRWIFELTPAFLGNLPDLQLAFLSAALAGGEAYLQYGTEPRRRYAGMGLAGLMAAGLVLGLYSAGSDPTGSNVMRMLSLALVLGMVVLDHVSLLETAERAEPVAVASEAEAVEAPAAEPEPSPAADVDALLASLVEEGEGLLAEGSVEEEIAELEGLAEEAEVVVQEEEKKEEAEVEEDAEFALEDLDAFETWIEMASETAPDKEPARDEPRRARRPRRRLRWSKKE